MASGQQRQQSRRNGGKAVQVLDGSDIRELVENKEEFAKFVESKFRHLDRDGDGRLSVRELQPAVADIGAAIGLPARGSSAQADHIYSEVLNEFTHGKQDSVSKQEFQVVLSDILLGMAAGLQRDPIVILRMNGEDLNEFVHSSTYETEAVAIFSQVGQSGNASLRQCLSAALRQLTVDQGMPPASDSLVFTLLTNADQGIPVVENIIEPATQQLSADQLDGPASHEAFFQEFRKYLGIIARRLQERPVIVAHSENTFDGAGVKKILSNKAEFDKLLDSMWGDVPKEHKDRTSKKYIRVAFDRMAASVNLPPYGAVDQMVNADDGKPVDEAEFKKMLTEVLGAVMLQLDGKTISVSSNTVLHEPMSTPSSLLSPSPSSPMVSSPSE
ncbi:hypothetical protein ACQ4PT_070246 [Festuca glaucescens]